MVLSFKQQDMAQKKYRFVCFFWRKSLKKMTSEQDIPVGHVDRFTNLTLLKLEAPYKYTSSDFA